jgi:hypothetical protein
MTKRPQEMTIEIRLCPTIKNTTNSRQKEQEVTRIIKSASVLDRILDGNRVGRFITSGHAQASPWNQSSIFGFL